MGFADEVAGDGRGGWHDQGSNMDASRFPVAQQTFANVPFQIVDPKKNDGKSIVVMECPRLPNGPKQIEIPLSVPVSGRYLYLLHCSAWGQENGSVAGWIDVCGDRGGKVEIPVVYGKDLIDWWGEKGAANAVSGTPVAAKGGTGSVYVSRFELPETVLPVQKVIFRKKADANAMWMLVGATLSEKKYRYPEQKKQVMREDRVWKALPQRIAPVPKAGTALDLSGLFPKHRTGEFGRVVIGKNGQFEFEKRPGIPLRFLSFSMGREFWNHYNGGIELSDKQTIDAFVEQVERSGYNMVRVWANALRDMEWKTLNAFEFSERILDLLDEDGMRSLEKVKRITNNSVVGMSKLLHFINPTVFPMYDSNIGEVFGGFSDVTSYVGYVKGFNEICSEFAVDVSKFAKSERITNLRRKCCCDEKFFWSYRLVELVLFRMGKNLKREKEKRKRGRGES